MISITEALRRQMKINQGKNLLYSSAAQLLEIDPTFLAALENMAANASSIPEETVTQLASSAADDFIDRIYHINQYLQVSGRARNALKEIYLQSWENIFTARDIEIALRRYHFPRLISWIQSLYPETLKRALSSEKMIGAVPCQEYTAEFQINLYSLNLKTMKLPILDLGCGKNALLVNYLRRHHIEAYGIDRILSQRNDYLREMDWLATDQEPDKWGTILSNMAFSNHFNYVQRYESERIASYLESYKKMLNSLRVMGSFVYGPSAPGLENEIDPKRYTLEKKRVAGIYEIVRVTKVTP